MKRQDKFYGKNRSNSVQKPSRIDRNINIDCYESILRTIAGISAERLDLETGGDLWGYYDRAGNPVVLMATGPGSKAIFEHSHFAQDADYTLEAGRILYEKHGMIIVGTFHSHHKMGLSRPSGGDDRTVMSLADKNNIRNWVMIVATHEYPGKASEHTLSRLSVRINAYLYPEPEKGESIRVPIRVLAGDSPIRKTLLSNNDPAFASLCKWAPWLPMERILFDKYEPQHISIDVTENFPTYIIDQVKSLPLKTQRTVTLSMPDAFIAVRFAVTKRNFVIVFYSERAPYNICDIEFAANNRQTSVIGGLADKCNRLDRIHYILRSSSIRLARKSRSAKQKISKILSK